MIGLIQFFRTSAEQCTQWLCSDSISTNAFRSSSIFQNFEANREKSAVVLFALYFPIFIISGKPLCFRLCLRYLGTSSIDGSIY